ncbi:precorrin-3B C(17)-methyltransferase [Desulfovibrio oxyclinae]|uniref:precorrin-3B C(17)-methyltransferase n=1 Tax=Desulfovibrio oxyclinae TaxID=63560 RepID=UPI00036E6692|nr:precorrin-3B C(17)-methyltransferase [Desulfovibrio oxyclinae]
MLVVVSLGPGDESLMAPAARQALEGADAVVGYRGYIELVSGDLLEGKEVVATGMRGEVERVTSAVELAASGRNVALVCSGDAGIYAMAGLALEILESRGLLASVPFRVIPGIAAFNAAAALLGAPLMHDFASVSLSDLLTPWEAIERRIEAAASADFVLALYNPRSRKRREQLPRALEIVARHRLGSTPVGIVSRAARPGEKVTVTELAAVDPEAVDMQTVVLIGNSATRRTGEYMLTPRGYHDKYEY